MNLEINPIRWKASRHCLFQSLQRSAFFAETHSIKGILSLNRLSEHFPEIGSALWEQALNWNQVLQAPKIVRLISQDVQWDVTSLTLRRIRALIEGAVFPMAYAAAVEWVKRNGLEDLILSFKESAIRRAGYLGHSWTIWCSFYEVTPLLDTEEERFFAAERFVEFVASQLSSPDWMSGYNLQFDLVQQSISNEEVINAVCSYPGFWGHTLITVAHLYRHRKLISSAEWENGMERMLQMAKRCETTEGFNMYVEAPLHFAKKDLELLPAVTNYFETVPREVHAITLADSVCELWKHAGEKNRAHLLEVLNIFRQWKLERDLSGERKSNPV